MKVQEVMTTDVATTTPDVLLKDAALELVRHRISGMPVVDDDRHVLGVLSETDILAKEGGEHRSGGFLQWLVDPGDPWIAARFDAVTVDEAMSAPARTIRSDRHVAEAATIMLDEDVNRLPVVDDDGKLVGLVSRGDLVRAFTRSDEEILREIEEDVIRKVMWLSPSSVDVTVTKGVVTLSGEVASEADAELLPTFARKVPGVVDVISSLTHRDA
jgi:CBS-domain-containing membrane protein